MIVKLIELAEFVGGTVIGDGSVEISQALPLQDAEVGCLTFIDHPKYVSRAKSSQASAVMVATEIEDLGKPTLLVKNLHESFQQAIGLLRPKQSDHHLTGVHISAVISRSTRIGEGTAIGAGVVIGDNCVIGQRCTLHAGVQIMDNCQLGDDCELFPHVTLYPSTRLGHRCLLHASAVLGAYGFGYKLEQGKHIRTSQLGWVELGDDVEIGAATTIDRGSYGPTKIGEGTKIDNQVQIGHNCHIGRNNLICAQVGVAGSTSTGENVVLAGQVGIADHVHLADNVIVGAQAGVIGNLEAGSVVIGSPASPRRQQMLEWALLPKLPQMWRDLKELKELRIKYRELSQQSEAVPAPATNSDHKKAA